MEFIIIIISLAFFYVLFKVWRSMWVDRHIVIQDFKDRYKSTEELQAKDNMKEENNDYN